MYFSTNNTDYEALSSLSQKEGIFFFVIFLLLYLGRNRKYLRVISLHNTYTYNTYLVTDDDDDEEDDEEET